MSNTSLTQQLLSQLQGAPLQQISQQLGTDQSQTSSAISAALPLLMGALGKNAAQPSGAASLLGALSGHSGGGDIAGLVGSMLGGGGQSAGSSILGHIFGNNQSNAASGLSQATGLGGAQAGQLLAMLAPVVMGFLSKQTSQQGLDAGGLSKVLGQEQQNLQQQGGLASSLLTSVLDQDGDGQLGLGDLLKAGSSLLGKKA